MSDKCMADVTTLLRVGHTLSEATRFLGVTEDEYKSWRDAAADNPVPQMSPEEEEKFLDAKTNLLLTTDRVFLDIYNKLAEARKRCSARWGGGVPTPPGEMPLPSVFTLRRLLADARAAVCPLVEVGPQGKAHHDSWNGIVPFGVAVRYKESLEDEHGPYLRAREEIRNLMKKVNLYLM